MHDKCKLEKQGTIDSEGLLDEYITGCGKYLVVYYKSDEFGYCPFCGKGAEVTE